MVVYKVLITTYITSQYGNAVSTVVVDFATSELAKDAASRINTRQCLGGLIYRQAELLN